MDNEGTSPVPIRVVVVDDHPMLRRSVRWACEGSDVPIDIVGEAKDGAGALALAADLAPDVVVLDLELPGLHGLEVLRELRSSGSSAKVLILTADDDDDLLFEALRLEADGFLDKTVGPDEICTAITSVVSGERVLTAHQEAIFMERFGDYVRRSRGDHAGPAALSSEETSVLGYLAAGATTRQIAGAMHVSVRTVEGNITRLYRKMGASNRVGLVHKARTLGHISGQTGRPGTMPSREGSNVPNR